MKIAHISRIFLRLTVFAIVLLTTCLGSARVVLIDPERDQVCNRFIDDPARVLGFDPHADRICPAVGDGNMPIVVCAHGFGDSKNNFASRLENHMPGCPREQFVCFNFRDYRLANGWMVPQLRHANLGQEPDARVVLFQIIKCFCQGHKNIVLFAHSRGCAATIRALDMLFDPYKYRKVWEDFGFFNNGCVLRGGCIRAIQRAIGRVYLARPLLDIRQALLIAGQQTTGNYLAPVTAMVLSGFARVFARYTIRAEEPIELLKRLLLQAQFNFYVFFAPHDRVVGNKYDDLVTSTLARDPANQSTLEVHSTGIEHIEVKDAADALHKFLLTS